jgi:ATP-dependent DNA helicase RecQ
MSARKLQEFGQVCLAVIAGHLETQPRQMFAATSFEEPPAKAARARPIAAADDSPYDRELFERLRAVRLQLAAARGVPAYMILHDSALREMARVCPQNAEEFARIPHVGAKKAHDFAAQFVGEILGHLRSNPRRP